MTTYNESHPAYEFYKMGYEFGRNEVWNLEIEDKKETPQEANKRLQKQGLWTRVEQEAWEVGRKQGYSDGCEDI